MTAVVEEGTGSVLKGRSYTAAGKTGTAEYSMSDGEKDTFLVYGDLQMWIIRIW